MRWRLARPDSSMLFWGLLRSSFGGTWGQSYINGRARASVGCQSTHIFLFNAWPGLIRSRHHFCLSIHQRCRSIFFSPTFYLPQRARFLLFLSPRHDLFWLPDVLLCSFLWSLGEKPSENPIHSFCKCFGVQHSVGLGPRSHAGREQKEWKRGKTKSKWSHVLCPRSLGGSFNKRNALNSSRVLLFSV